MMIEVTLGRCENSKENHVQFPKIFIPEKRLLGCAPETAPLKVSKKPYVKMLAGPSWITVPKRPLSRMKSWKNVHHWF